ncbi:hypothetical protein B0H13DRAFT_1904230 [Mycena leptocephala]|nr:hypothetical protein B0H13DRAFT_1904230 [Mycena leptocephala]
MPENLDSLVALATSVRLCRDVEKPNRRYPVRDLEIYVAIFVNLVLRWKERIFEHAAGKGVCILYGYFDPDALFPDLWNEFNDSPEPAASIMTPSSPPTPLATSSVVPPTLAPLHHAIHPARFPAPATFPSTTLSISTHPRPEYESVPGPVPLVTALFAFDIPESPRIQEIDFDPDHRDHLRDDSRAEEDPKVPPSDELAGIYRVGSCTSGGHWIGDCGCEESSVYFCGNIETTDHSSEFHRFSEQVTASRPSVRDEPELSPDSDFHKSDCAPTDESREGFTWSEDLARQVNEDIRRFRVAKFLEYYKSQMSSIPTSIDQDSGETVETGVDGLCDAIPSPETDIATGDSEKLRVHSFELSSCSALLEPDITDESQRPLTFSAEFNDELERYLAGDYSDCDEASSTYPFSDYDSGTITGSDVESIFDLVPDPETDTEVGDINELSSVAFHRDSDCESEVETDPQSAPPHNSELTKLSPMFFANDSDLLSYLARVLLERSSPHEAEPTELATTSAFKILGISKMKSESTSLFSGASYVDYFVPELFDLVPELPASKSTELVCAGAEVNSSKKSHDFQHKIVESSSSVPRISYVNFFVPGLFDIEPEMRACHSHEFSNSGAPDDDLPSHRPSISASTSSFPFVQVRIKAEYLQFIISWLVLCWRLVLQGFCSIKSAIQPPFCDDSVPEIPDPVVIDSCEPMDDDRDFCGQDSIDIFAEPVPPDKSFSSHLYLFVHPRSSLDSELTDIVVQDIADFSTALPHVQAIKLDNPPKVTDSDSVYSIRAEFKVFPRVKSSFRPDYYQGVSGA